MRAAKGVPRRRAGADHDHIGRRLRTLEECALHKRTLRLTCPKCGHVRVLDALRSGGCSTARLGRHARIGWATAMLLDLSGGRTHPASPCGDRAGPAHRCRSALSGRRDVEEACLALPVVIEQANV